MRSFCYDWGDYHDLTLKLTSGPAMVIDAPECSDPRKKARAPGSQLPSLTSLRGLAALWVVLYHYSVQCFPSLDVTHFTHFISKGYLAVDMFFMLSGFVMTHVYYRVFANTESIKLHYRSFLVARVARLYPMHVFVLFLFVTTALTSQMMASSATGTFLGIPWNGPESITAAVANVLMLQGLDAGKLSWNYPAWSISVEFMAYLVFPLILPIIWRASNSRKTSFGTHSGYRPALARVPYQGQLQPMGRTNHVASLHAGISPGDAPVSCVPHECAKYVDQWRRRHVGNHRGCIALLAFRRTRSFDRRTFCRTHSDRRSQYWAFVRGRKCPATDVVGRNLVLPLSHSRLCRIWHNQAIGRVWHPKWWCRAFERRFVRPDVCDGNIVPYFCDRHLFRRRGDLEAPSPEPVGGATNISAGGVARLTARVRAIGSVPFLLDNDGRMTN